ncbi:unnamed protein product, partial [Medioppia subpectinata]
MMAKEGINRPLDDEYFTIFKYVATLFSHHLGNKYILYEYIPYFRPFMSDPLIKFRSHYKQCLDYLLNVLKTHEMTYDENNCRDVCDMFIGAKRKAKAECRPGVEWLTDDNITATFIDLFVGGVDTTYATLQWLVLFVAYFEDW